MKTENFECTISQLELEVQPYIYQYLSKNESPLICVKFKGSGYYRVGVITEEKVIEVGSPEWRGKIGPTFFSTCTYLDDITGLQHYSLGKKRSSVGFTTKSDKQKYDLYFDDNELKDKFISIFQRVKFKNNQKVERRSPFERLGELCHMHEKGNISDTEFNELKEKILRDL